MKRIIGFIIALVGNLSKIGMSKIFLLAFVVKTSNIAFIDLTENDEEMSMELDQMEVEECNTTNLEIDETLSNSSDRTPLTIEDSNSKYLFMVEDSENSSFITFYSDNATNKMFYVQRYNNVEEDIEGKDSLYFNSIFETCATSLCNQIVDIKQIKHTPAPKAFQIIIEEKIKTLIIFTTFLTTKFMGEKSIDLSDDVFNKRFYRMTDLQKIDYLGQYISNKNVHFKNTNTTSEIEIKFTGLMRESTILNYFENCPSNKISKIKSRAKQIYQTLKEEELDLLEVESLLFKTIKSLPNALDRFLVFQSYVWNRILMNEKHMSVIRIINIIVYLKNEYLFGDNLTGKLNPNFVIPTLLTGYNKVSMEFYLNVFAIEEKKLIKQIIEGNESMYGMFRLIYINSLTTPFVQDKNFNKFLIPLIAEMAYKSENLETLHYFNLTVTKIMLKLMEDNLK